MRICFSFISGHEKFIHPPRNTTPFRTPQRLRFSTRIVSEVVDSGWLVGFGCIHVSHSIVHLFACAACFMERTSRIKSIRSTFPWVLLCSQAKNGKRILRFHLFMKTNLRQLPQSLKFYFRSFAIIYWPRENPRRIANNAFAFCI